MTLPPVKTFGLWGPPPVGITALNYALFEFIFFAQNERCACAATVSLKYGDIEMRPKRKMKRKLKYVDCLMPLGAGDDTLLPLGGDLGLLPLSGDLGLLPLGASDDLLLPLGQGDDLLRPIGEMSDSLRPIGELGDELLPRPPVPPVKTS